MFQAAYPALTRIGGVRLPGGPPDFPIDEYPSIGAIALGSCRVSVMVHNGFLPRLDRVRFSSAVPGHPNDEDLLTGSPTMQPSSNAEDLRLLSGTM